MERKRRIQCGAVGALLLAAILGGCAADAPNSMTDPMAKQKADREKQKELSEMEQAGKRD